MGYLISAHTNSTDCYSCSRMWTEDMVCTFPDGSFAKNGVWCGGRACFSYDYIGSLKNGVQVLKIFDNGGGSWTDCRIRFLGFEKCSTFFFRRKINFCLCQKLRHHFFRSKRGLFEIFHEIQCFRHIRNCFK